MKVGSLGEISVQKEFILSGYEVYSPVTDNTKYDLIASKDGKVYTVEVKSTNRKVGGFYRVQIKKVRSNKTRNVVTRFDNTQVDLLAIYIEPEDRVIVYKAEEITVGSELRVDMDGDLQRSVTRS